ncbi:von Willebrand factor A domain-containing protein 1 [Sigmodon hispidus]
MNSQEFGILWGSWCLQCRLALGLCVLAWCMWAVSHTQSLLLTNIVQARLYRMLYVLHPNAWVTPIQELKDLGVTIFIVSTGRGNLLELLAAASAPAEKHLHFVDVDDLHIIAPELRDSITDAMQPQQQLRASEVLSNGFRLTWPPLLTADSGYYVLELMPSDKLVATRRQQLPGNATSWIWTDLNPDTDYEVVLLPESNVHLLRPQRVRVRTLQEEAGPERIIISHTRPRSLRISWAPALGPDSILGYHIQLGPLRGGSAQRVEVPAGHNSTTIQGLTPGTAYLVTVTAAFRSGRERALSAKACTAPGERTRAPQSVRSVGG